MAVKKIEEKYFCKVCGSKAKANKKDGKNPVCCDHKITLMTE